MLLIMAVPLAIAVLVEGAAAHSLLIESTPAPNTTIDTLPRELVLRFNNRIEKKLSKVRVVGGNGKRAELPVAATGRTDTLTAVMPALAAGLWRVEWQVLSTDGHVVTGVFSFRLGP
jgi:methionine-rich copper-binding protein CopC